MKHFFAATAAALLLSACGESTAPASSTGVDLTPSYAKPAPPATYNGCTNCTVDGFYDFSGGVVTATGGSSVATDVQPGDLSTASDADVVTAPSGEQFLGRFANVRTMVVVNVPSGNPKYSLEFDFYAIGSWDGRGKQAQNGVFDANVFDVGYRCVGTTATTSIFKTTFSNQQTVQQDYPNAFLTGGFKAATNSVAVDELNYRSAPALSNTPQFRSFGDVSYHFGYNGTNPCGSDAVQFTISTSNPSQQSVYDESWGVDNIHIKAGN